MARRFNKPKKDIGLNITSMMDMFTIMLVFMLKNFAAEGNIVTNADNLVLPYSESKKSPEEVHVAMNCSHDWVIIDNEPVVPTPTVKNQDDAVVSKIKEKLDHCMAQEEKMVRIGAINRVKGIIIIQIDKNMGFDIVYKLMASCGAAGYNDIRLAVMSHDA